MKSKELMICQSKRDIESGARGVFTIEEELKQISNREYTEIYNILNDMNIDDNTSLPLFNIFRLPLIRGTRDQESLVNLVYIYKKLENEVTQKDIQSVHIKNVDTDYRYLLKDLAEENSIEIETDSKLKKTTITKKIIILGLAVSVLLIDEIIAGLYSVLISRPLPTDTIFVPSIGRFGSTEPVIQNMSNNYAIILPTIFLRSKIDNNIKKTLSNYSYMSIGVFASTSTLARQISFIFLEFLPELIIRDTFRKNITSEVRLATGVYIPKAIDYRLYKSISINTILGLLRYFLMKVGVEKLDVNNVVVGIGYGPPAESLWLGGKNGGSTTYDLPHTIAVNPPAIGQFSDYKFVSGKLEKERSKNDSESTGTDLITTGRPYLERLRGTSSTPKQTESECIQILIATQPYEPNIKRKFVQTVLEAISISSYNHQIIIKTHPDEDPGFYAKVIPEDSEVKIRSNGLESLLRRADLVITINSNVGLEAIITGTGSVCVNLWEHSIRCLPYALDGPVPVLRTKKDINSFFRNLDESTLKDIYTSQADFISTAYELSNTSSRIVNSIESLE